MPSSMMNADFLPHLECTKHPADSSGDAFGDLDPFVDVALDVETRAEVGNQMEEADTQPPLKKNRVQAVVQKPLMVESEAGGLASCCRHLDCRLELYACCMVSHCAAELCHLHLGQSRCHEHGNLASRLLCPCVECVALRDFADDVNFPGSAEPPPPPTAAHPRPPRRKAGRPASLGCDRVFQRAFGIPGALVCVTHRACIRYSPRHSCNHFSQ
jgi:hypothetical protein